MTRAIGTIKNRTDGQPLVPTALPEESAATTQSTISNADKATERCNVEALQGKWGTDGDSIHQRLARCYHKLDIYMPLKGACDAAKQCEGYDENLRYCPCKGNMRTDILGYVPPAPNASVRFQCFYKPTPKEAETYELTTQFPAMCPNWAKRGAMKSYDKRLGDQ